MMRNGIPRTFIGWAVAIALSTIAVGSRNKYPGDANRAGQPATGGAAGTAGSTAAGKSPVTLSGCLQKSDARGDYMLTEVNTPPASVGTSGSTARGASPDAVGQ